MCDEFLAPVRGMFVPGDPRATVLSIGVEGALVMCEIPRARQAAGWAHYDNLYAWAVEVKDGRIFAIREYMDSHYVAKLFGMPEARHASRSVIPVCVCVGRGPWAWALGGAASRSVWRCGCGQRHRCSGVQRDGAAREERWWAGALVPRRSGEAELRSSSARRRSRRLAGGSARW